jgi:uncharacterized membrane protein
MWYTYLLAALMGLAGVNHFLKPAFYLAITPKYLPFPNEINYLAGVVQILFCIGLIYPGTRLWSAYGVMAMMVVFQIMIHAVHFVDTPKALQGKMAMIIIRFLLQFVIIWWAWMVAQKALQDGL